MTFKELLLAVRDENLPLQKLEQYRDALVHLHSDFQIEMAAIERNEAFFFINHKGESDVATKRTWRITPEGMRGIELNRHIKAICKEIDSLKSRIYAQL